MLVFYHNATGGHLFSNESEAIHTDSFQKYSVLDKINTDFLINGKYEFLLEYPGINGYNRWRQSLNPLHDIEQNGCQAKGYEPIQVQWTVKSFGGLVRSSQVANNLIDGSAGVLDHWWYSIGNYVGNSWSYANCPPNGGCFGGPGEKAYIQHLWIRINEKSTNICYTFPFQTSTNIKYFLMSLLFILLQ